jgi:hypothetical protein
MARLDGHTLGTLGAAAVKAKYQEPIGRQRRFWAKVQIGNLDECWPWIASFDKRGYGQVRFDGANHRAPRVAYAFAHGIIEGTFDSAQLCLHTCDNSKCCNPGHLYLGNQSRNVQDAYDRKRRSALRGEACPRSKLTESQVKEIRELAKAPNCNRTQLARQFGVRWQTVTSILTGRTWRHI